MSIRKPTPTCITCTLSCTFVIYCHWPKYIFFSGTLVTCNMLIFGNLVVNPVHFLLTENIKRDNKGIILWFYYLVQNINVDALMWFFCWISTILMQCLEISSLLSTVSQFVSHIIFIFYHGTNIVIFFLFKV